MQRRRKWVLIGMLATILICTSGGAAVIYHFRPLVYADDYVVVVNEEDERECVATVYRMLGRSEVLFVELAGTLESSLYQWFTVDVQSRRVAVPNAPDRDPYLHFNHDMDLGVFLGDTKIDDNWVVNWSDGTVAFSNGTFSLRVERYK